MNGNGHHELAPSSFPAWALCLAFDSDPAEREDATAGTAQHAALAALLRDERNLCVSRVFKMGLVAASPRWDYCGFCAHRTTCPAITGQVEAVARTSPTWEDLAPAIRDPAAITDPTLAANALTVARYVSTWADAIRARATELAKGGAALPGYRLQERRGAREVTDLDAAFTRTGLTPRQFVSACKLSLPKLGDAFATARAMSKAAAGREVEAMLADLIPEGTPTVSLVADRKGEAFPTRS